jgi:hypothetical protein
MVMLDDLVAFRDVDETDGDAELDIGGVGGEA